MVGSHTDDDVLFHNTSCINKNGYPRMERDKPTQWTYLVVAMGVSGKYHVCHNNTPFLEKNTCIISGFRCISDTKPYNELGHIQSIRWQKLCSLYSNRRMEFNIRTVDHRHHSSAISFLCRSNGFTP